jgi:hypothetical protein
MFNNLLRRKQMNNQNNSSGHHHFMVRGTILLIVALVIAAINQVYAAGTPLSIAGYLGFHYGNNVKEDPTGEKPESKLWWHDGRWWGSLFSPANNEYRIHYYDVGNHNWVATATVIDNRLDTRADVLWDGAANKLYIVSHVKVENPGKINDPDNWARLYRYSYDAGAKTYSLEGGFPVTVNHDKTETVVIDKDSAGRLWITYVSREQGSSQYQVYVNVSTNDGLTWDTPFALSFGEATVASDDISSLIAFSDSGGAKIGIMWSSHISSKFYFATHSDSSAPQADWNLETINFPFHFPANDHMNLAVTSSGQVLAAVKSNPYGNDPDPLVLVVARDADGSYSFHPVSLVRDQDTRPIVVINGERNEAHVFATGKTGGGSVCQWIAEIPSPLSSMAFVTADCPAAPQAGAATIVLGDQTYNRISNVTSTKQRVNGQTNLLILASDERADTKVYVHNYLEQEQMPGDGDAHTIYMPMIIR